jgi:hypothetical protein
VSAAEALLLGWAALAMGFSWVAWVRLRPRPAPSGTRRWPAVLLVRPIDSPSAAELEALAAPIDYGGPLTHCVLSPERPPLPASVTWVPSDPRCANRKVGHLLRGLELDAGAVMVSVDADVQVDAALLEALVGAVERSAALAWAAPVPQGAGAERGVLAHSHHSFAALDAMRLGAPTVCGKAIALGPAARALLPEVQHCIGEDLELSTLLHRQGQRIERVAVVAKTLARPGALARFTRWMQVLRAHRPALWPLVPLLLAPAPLLVPLLVCTATPAALEAAVLLLLSRTLLSLRLATVNGSRGAAWEWALGEALLLAAFARAVLKRTVAWRGRHFTLERGGTMRPVAP